MAEFSAESEAFFSHKRYVFLDRDGVINLKAPEGEYVWNWRQFRVFDGVEAAIAKLNRSGRRVFVVTNQSGVASGRYSIRAVEELHAQLQMHLARFGAHIDGFYVCPHEKGTCDCRKPLTGLFEQALADHPEITREEAVMIGDSLSDIEAARNFAISSVLILANGQDQTSSSASEAVRLATTISTSLAAAVEEFFRWTDAP